MWPGWPACASATKNWMSSRRSSPRCSTTPPTSKRSTSSGIEPTSHPQPLTDVTRADEVRPSLERDEVLAQAPSVAEGQFRVPPILGEAP